MVCRYTIMGFDTLGGCNKPGVELGKRQLLRLIDIECQKLCQLERNQREVG